MQILLENILNMNKFGLVGKDISHSRSPEMYRKLISLSIQYDLLDYKSENEIPPASDLLEIYDGINITSPYKKHFLEQVELTPIAFELGAINCLKKKNGKIIGENTDYLAIIDTLKYLQRDYGEIEVIILGDGVMAKVTMLALKNLGLVFKVLSRKKTKFFNQLNLIEYFNHPSALPVVINSCSREFIFNGTIPDRALFWDFNYNFDQHSASIPGKVYKYVDGLAILELQAFYAVAFWSK
jgi:shikimate dehydrogenase